MIAYDMCNCTVEEAATALANCGFRAMYDNKLSLSLLASGGTTHMDTAERIRKHLATLITFVVFATILTWIKTSGEWVMRAQEPRAQALRYVVICVILIVGYVAADQWVYETYPDTHQCMSVCSSVVWESISATPSMTAGLVYRHMERKHPNTTLAGMQAVDKAYGAFCDMHQVAQRGYNKVAGFQTAVFKRIQHMMYMTTRHCLPEVAASETAVLNKIVDDMCYIVYEAPSLHHVYQNKSIQHNVDPRGISTFNNVVYPVYQNKASSDEVDDCEVDDCQIPTLNTTMYGPVCKLGYENVDFMCVAPMVTTPPPVNIANVSEAMSSKVWDKALISVIQILTSHKVIMAVLVLLPLRMNPVDAQPIPTTPAFDPTVAIGGGGALTALVIFGLWVNA